MAAVARPATEPSPPSIWTATLAHFDFRPAPAIERAGTGKGATDAEAKLGAIAEALERYAGYHARREMFLYAAYAGLSEAAISPAELVLYSEEQYARPGFRYRPFDERSPIAWVRGWDVRSRREIWLPAGFVYLNYFADSLAPPDSTGLAAGPDLEAAILSGLSEIIERDAFVVTWLRRLPAPEVDIASLGDLDRSIAQHYARSGVETRVVRLSTDFPAAVMMALAIDRTGNGPAAVVGLGCHLDPRIAARKALFELCQVRPGIAADSGLSLARYEDVQSMMSHAEYFSLPQRLAELDFLWGGGGAELESRSTGSVEGDLALLAEALPGAAYIDITTPDLEEFPLRVARVLAPGLQPIHFGYGQERLGGARLDLRNLNPCPHPLA